MIWRVKAACGHQPAVEGDENGVTPTVFCDKCFGEVRVVELVKRLPDNWIKPRRTVR